LQKEYKKVKKAGKKTGKCRIAKKTIKEVGDVGNDYIL